MALNNDIINNNPEKKGDSHYSEKIEWIKCYYSNYFSCIVDDICFIIVPISDDGIFIVTATYNELIQHFTFYFPIDEAINECLTLFPEITVKELLNMHTIIL